MGIFIKRLMSVIKQKAEWLVQLVVLVVDGRWRCFHSDITSHARRNMNPDFRRSYLGTCGKPN
jgi:hypothetical protein